jgi:lysophospholipase L1-like esterase
MLILAACRPLCASVTRLFAILAAILVLACLLPGKVSAQRSTADLPAGLPVGNINTGLPLSADSSSLPVRTVLHLTSAAGAGATGTITFLTYPGLIPIATVPVDHNGNGAAGVASLTAGQVGLVAYYAGDGAHAPAVSSPVSVTITAVPAPFTVSANPATVIAGAPLSVMAAGLPPDATGTVSYSDPNGQFASAVMTTASAPVLTAFGDFATRGDTLPTAALAYPALLASSFGMSNNNLGSSAASGCDVMTLEIFQNAVSPNQSNASLYSVMIGSNDANDPNYQPTYTLCHQAALAWLGTPREYKVLAGDAGAVPLSGNWTLKSGRPFDATWGTLYTSANTGTVRFAVTTSGGPIYLWYLLDRNGPASEFTVAIDGVPTGSSYGAGTMPSFSLNSATGQGIALLRLGAAAGAHSIDVSVVAGPVGILGVATPPSPGAASVHPLVLAASVPSQNTSSPRDLPVYLAAYSADAKADATLLAGDGLNITWIDTSQSFTGDPADMSDSIDPNAQGQAQLAAAFRAALSGISLAPYNVSANSIPPVAGTLAGAGVHGVFGTYSGDLHYASTQSLSVPVTVADPYTNTTIAISSSSVAYNTPIVFTASVQPVASQGSFTFLDRGSIYLGTAEIPGVAGNGIGSVALTLPTGSHSVTAVYHSTDYRESSISAPMAVTVGLEPTNLSLVSSVTSMAYGGSTQLSAVVTPLAATGTVTFVDSLAGPLGQVVLDHGLASLTTVPLGAGNHSLTLVYSGDALYLPGSSAPVPVHVSQIQAPVVSFLSPQNPSFGSPLTLQVSLLGQGTPALQPAVNTIASDFNRTSVFFGDSITAYWTLPINNQGIVGETCAQIQDRFAEGLLNHGYQRVLMMCGANDILHTSNDVPTTMGSIEAMAATATANNIPIVLATMLPISINGVSQAARVDPLNAAITAFAAQMGYPLLDYHTSMAQHPEYQGDGVHPDPRGYVLMQSVIADTLLIPTGTVALPDGTKATLSDTGTATLTVSSLPVGTLPLQVSYNGDANFTSSSTAFSVLVGQAATTTALTAQSLISYTGSSAVLTANVASTASAQPSGSISFADGSNSLGSAPLAANGIATLTTSNLTNGIHSFTAAYAGNGNFSASTSAAATLTVRYANTTLSLSSARSSYAYADTVTLNAMLNPTGGTGTITFLDGAQALAQVPVAGGVASFSSTSLALGTHTLTAIYSGDSYDSTAQSPPLSLTIGTRATVLTLLGLSPASTYGTALSVQATLAPSAASGSVTFTDSFLATGQTSTQTQTLGTVALGNGTAVLALPSLAVGTHSISAVYAGDQFDQAANSVPVATIVSSVPTSAAVTLSSATIAFGVNETFTVTVSPANATGMVTLVDSISGQLGQSSLIKGVASFTSSALAPGLHSITANYAGDANHTTSTSPTAQLNVTTATSSITLAAPQATIYIGTSLTLSASVQPSAATGTVVFRDSAQGVLGQASITHGIATLTLPNLPVAAYNISASYSGDTNDSAGISNSISAQVLLNPSTISLAALPASVPYTTPLTLTANVTPASATGTISFFDGSNMIASATLTNGIASAHLATLAVGTHSLHANFAGSALVAASASVGTTILAITDDNTATALSLSETSVPAGSQVSFNVQVSSTAMSAPPTGTVSIRSGSALLGSVSLAHGSGSTAYATLTINSSSLGIGTFPVAAYYSGDSTNTLSDSSAIALSFQVVATSTSASVQLSSPTVAVQAAITVSASVQAAGGVVPTGNMTFYSNNVAFASAPLNASGSVSATLPTKSIGSFAVTAVYAPTGLFAPSTAPAQTLLVTPPLSVLYPSSAVNVAIGSSGSANIAITPLSGFTGAVTMACSTSVSYLSCTVESPGTIASGASVTATVRLAVQKSLAAADVPAHRNATLPMTCGTLLGLLLLPLARRGRAGRLRADVAAMLLLLLLGVATFGLAGCGGAGTFFNVPTGTQNVQVTVSAAGVTVAGGIAVNVTQ